ncbi:MAG: Multidrug resistance protein MdtC [Alphaproteobacteria bacterium MarineAlpha2_Bin1]|nr:MAG: Multidrug resistance protein MdtC [Alphaproteobacteria bacterium MarineAlpha2_Bin1]
MNIIKLSIEKPIAVISVVVMVLIFGWVSLNRIPIQMSPDVRQPIISITTNWPGAAPVEVEREIIKVQEEVLGGLRGVERIQSSSRPNQGNIQLNFKVGSDMNQALLLVSNRLDLIREYPEDAQQPFLSTSGTEDNSIAWFSLQSINKENQRTSISNSEIVNDIIKEKLERIDGVSSLYARGVSERELRVTIDPYMLAKYSLTVSELINKIRQSNISITGGSVEEGKRRYVVRTEGDLTSIEQVENIILRTNNQNGTIGRVSLGDVANVDFLYKERRAYARRFGSPTLTMSLTGEAGSNVIETMAKIKYVVSELSESTLKKLNLKLIQLYDETDYIKSAINLVLQNIFIGGLFAIIILLVFLKSWRATLVISISIPVSVIGSFVAMAILGRSLNVISLAGIAFAVGMVVDAAIVVLENIFRLRQSGKNSLESAFNGASQVWPAIFVSSLTTVMVFIPILIMDLEAGQLFRDIAVAISVSVILSLIVSVTLIPALSKNLFIDGINKNKKIPILDYIAKEFVIFWVNFSLLVIRRKIVACFVIILLSLTAILLTLVLMPKLDYLPTGNRNFVFGFIQTPPGYNLETTNKLTLNVEEETKKYWLLGNNETINKKNPVISDFFVVALEGRAFMGGKSLDASKASELIPIMQSPANKEPGTRAFMFQPSLFGRSVGGGRSIDIDISGDSLEDIHEVARETFEKVLKVLPFSKGHKIRPKPSLELVAPEVRVIPDPVRLANNGISVNELGRSIDVFNDGFKVTEINLGSKRLDLTLSGQSLGKKSTQSIASIPVVNSSGRVVPVSSVADIFVTSGPTEIRRIEKIRTVTISITPSKDLPLQAAMDKIKNEVISPMKEMNLSDGIKFNLSGTADKLTKTWNELIIDLFLALLIVYLVMAVLFGSFIYPFIILFSVPVAAAGGLAGLTLLNIWVEQPLDMLTILGFVILVGIVVNNAILLVHQTLYNIRKLNMDSAYAISNATKNRIRPIFMSTLTSVFGMLPLVLFPGSGSELYRGLGSVVVGGLSLSALLTMAIIPPMLSITVDYLEQKNAT